MTPLLNALLALDAADKARAFHRHAAAFAAATDGEQASPEAAVIYVSLYETHTAFRTAVQATGQTPDAVTVLASRVAELEHDTYLPDAIRDELAAAALDLTIAGADLAELMNKHHDHLPLIYATLQAGAYAASH